MPTTVPLSLERQGVGKRKKRKTLLVCSDILFLMVNFKFEYPFAFIVDLFDNKSGQKHSVFAQSEHNCVRSWFGIFLLKQV